MSALRPKPSIADSQISAPFQSLIAGPQPICRATFEQDGWPKELRLGWLNLLKRRHFLMQEIVADLDQKIGKKDLPGDLGFSHDFNGLSEPP
jgi:hypothetical protein